MGQAMRDKGDLNEAVRYYKRAVALRPDSAEARTDLGFALKRADRLQEALTELTKAVELAPDLPRGHFHLAEALSQKGDVNTALVEYEAARRLRPNDIEYAVKYGVALMATTRRGRRRVAACNSVGSEQLRRLPIAWPSPAAYWQSHGCGYGV